MLMYEAKPLIVACIPACNEEETIARVADPVKLGLTKPEDKECAYVQCVDPWRPYTDGGTVIFRLKRIA